MAIRAALVCLLGWLVIAPHTDGVRAAPARCAAPHRAASDLRAVIGHRVADSTMSTPGPYSPAVGEPAGEAIVAQVRATIELFVACWNSGDAAGVLSLQTDALLARRGADYEFTDEELAGTKPFSVPADQVITLRDLRDVTVLSDGRIEALVIAESGGNTGSASASVFTFVAGGDRLLIDDIRRVSLVEARATWQIVQGDGYRGAIVPLDEVVGFAALFGIIAVQGAWIPDGSEIQGLEAALPDFVASGLGAHSLPKPLSQYGRQYAGFVAGGRAYVLIIGFCDTTLDWTREPVAVSDGGSCFFHAIYEPATDTLSDLRFNGEA